MKKIVILIMALLCIWSASALEIIAPENTTYNSTAIPFSVLHNETLDNISYLIDQGNLVLVCENCSEYNTTLNVSEGTHNLLVQGTQENTTVNETVSFNVELPEVYPFTLTIVNPEPENYSTEFIPFAIFADQTLDAINYQLDNSSLVTACENCSIYISTLNVSEGTHNLLVQGVLENETVNKTVTFNVDLLEESPFTLEIINPQPIIYTTGLVPISIMANSTLDRISYEVGDNEGFCENCSGYFSNLNLTEGYYTLRTEGLLDNISREVFVQFSVQLSEEPVEPSEEENTTPKFSLGFNKLPKVVEAGNISDQELAQIIRENRLNPGILNRLIKTGKLGEDSVEAILETEFKPPSIIRKIFAFLGIQQDTYASLIYENYKLPTKLKQKLVARDDLPEEYSQHLSQELRKQEREQEKEQAKQAHAIKKEEKHSEEETLPNSLKIGKQNKKKPASPGQVKKAESTKDSNNAETGNDEAESEGSSSPNAGKGSRGSSSKPSKNNNGNGRSKKN